MLPALLIIFLVSSAYCVDIADVTDNTLSDVVGDYKLVFAWPKTSQKVPNCYPTGYEHMDFKGHRVTCGCGRKDAQIAVLWQKTRFISMAILFDRVSSFDEASRALGDSCRCEPFNYNRVVVQQLTDNLRLQYEQEEILRHYIFAKTTPSEAELREAIATIKDLKYEDGMLLCKEE